LKRSPDRADALALTWAPARKVIIQGVSF